MGAMKEWDGCLIGGTRVEFFLRKVKSSEKFTYPCTMNFIILNSAMQRSRCQESGKKFKIFTIQLVFELCAVVV